MAEKKYRKLQQLRIFVSSTYKDLIEHRKAVLESIHSLGNFTSDMIYWAADDRDPSTYSIDKLENCDLIILILSHRYGTTLAGDKRSVTEIEYDTAKDLNLPVIPFLVDPKHEWPFIYIDRDNYDHLEAFKRKVQQNHTSKQFTTPDHLARLVTEAVVQFVASETGLKLGKQFAPTVKLQKPVQHSSLLEIPDMSVVLGVSEDGLPLLLRINRSQELEEFFMQIEYQKPNLLKAFPDKIIDELRISLDDRRRLHPVSMRSNNIETMYITRRTLSIMFRSLMSSLIGKGGQTRQAVATIEPPNLFKFKNRDHIAHDPIWFTDEPIRPKTEPAPSLESTGGSNRFMGISLNTGKLYSVGKLNGKWVEWHPFITESLNANLPNTEFKIDASYFLMENGRDLIGSLEELESKLMNFATKQMPKEGFFDYKVNFKVKRQAIAELCSRIVDCVEVYHDQRAIIHGDLKPSNILLSDTGPILIDGFDLKEGTLSPGWTPFWSGPEQVTNEPMTFKADVYSLGRILVEVIGSYLIGEVKKFKVPALPSGRNEFDVFYNPTVHMSLNSNILTNESFLLWKTFLEQTLQYYPQHRPNLKEFKQKLEDLLIKAPLNGSVYFRVPGGICATEMQDGHQTLARIIDDFYLRAERPPIDDVEHTLNRP